MPEPTDNAGAGQTPTPGTPGPDNPPAGGETPQNFETWLEGQAPEIKTLLDTHTQGLKSALSAERENRKTLETQLRDAAAKAEKGSEAEKALTTAADRAAESDRRADFMEAAHGAGVTNLKLAYTVAVQDEMFDRKGAVNFETMKSAYPELFGAGKALAPPGNAGAGTGSAPPPAGGGMNEAIRRAAGR